MADKSPEGIRYACHLSVFWDNGVMARPGATHLESIIIIVIALKQNIK